jgi:hypothetical protein
LLCRAHALRDTSRPLQLMPAVGVGRLRHRPREAHRGIDRSRDRRRDAPALFPVPKRRTRKLKWMKGVKMTEIFRSTRKCRTFEAFLQSRLRPLATVIGVPIRGKLWPTLAVVYELAPAVPRDVAGWITIVERSDSLDPHGWNWKARFWRCSLLWSWLWFERRCILSWQFPEPLTTRTKTGSTRPYAKRFLRSSEELRVRDALMLTQESCPAGHDLECRYTHIVPCEGIP